MQIWDPGVPVEKKQKIYKYKALWRDLCFFVLSLFFGFFNLFVCCKKLHFASG